MVRVSNNRLEVVPLISGRSLCRQFVLVSLMIAGAKHKEYLMLQALQKEF